MARNGALPRPTDAELEILNVLWRFGPCTVAQVHGTLSQDREIGYTTVLKFLQIMKEKGLVERDERQRSHVYSARESEEQTQTSLVRDLLERAFEGSASKLVMRALSARKTTTRELEEIRKLLDSMQGGRK